MLYIMRHGLTDWNVLHRMQGQTDVPLNDEGRQMARKARKEYWDVHFDICFSSPLVRAYETAKLLLEGRDVPIVTDDRLKEMRFGVFEGAQEVFKLPDSPIIPLFKAPDQYVPVEGGESLEELFDRTGQFLEEEVEPRLKEGLDVLIVGHGVVNSSIICRARGNELKDLWQERIENCVLKHIK